MTITDLLANLDLHTAIYVMLVFGWDDVLFAFALMVISATITALVTKKSSTTDPAPAQLSEFQVPSIVEGTAQAVVFGDVWLTGWQVLWYGNLETEAIRAAKSGKK